ncbi:MAG: guanylate kinase [Planctomycetes bacterium]|nr:guanylate kinase [Planctomycetota bacterium]
MAPLILVSGPSGCGKSTLIRRLLDEGVWPLRLSVSATTRQPRTGEVDGVHYHFWTPAEFARSKELDAFLEWAEVHGNHYGTLVDEVTPFREKGVGVLLDIDVQGAEQVRKRCPDAVSIFVRTTTIETLEKRLRSRGTEREEVIQRRLAAARAEISRADEYDYQVINDDLDTALASMRAILNHLFG